MAFEPFSGIAILLLIQFSWILAAYVVFRKNANKGFFLLCLLALLLVYNSYRQNLDEFFSVPVDGIHSTFDEFYKRSKWPLQLDLITVKNTEYIEAVVSPGKIPSLIRLTTFRSGMPAYVFDTKGNLVDYTIDHHDEARYQDKWERPTARESVTKEDILMRIDQGKLRSRF